MEYRKPDLTIGIGDRVRSYDFPESVVSDRPQSYVEGIVFGLVHRDEDGQPFTCRMYAISPERVVQSGHEVDMLRYEGVKFYAPVNGTPSNMGGGTYGVVRV